MSDTPEFTPPVHMGPVRDGRPLCGCSLAESLDETTDAKDQVTCRACLAALQNRPWNRVTLGDGTEAILLPALACINRIREPDGHVSCNHTDAYACKRTGHETIATYEVVKRDDPRWWDGSEDDRRCKECGGPLDEDGHHKSEWADCSIAKEEA